MGNNASAHAEALKAIKRLSPTRDGWQRVLANFNKDVEGSMSKATEDQRFLEVGDKKVLDALYALINATLDKAPIPVADVRAPRPPSARRSRPCPPRRAPSLLRGPTQLATCLRATTAVLTSKTAVKAIPKAGVAPLLRVLDMTIENQARRAHA